VRIGRGKLRARLTRHEGVRVDVFDAARRRRVHERQAHALHHPRDRAHEVERLVGDEALERLARDAALGGGRGVGGLRGDPREDSGATLPASLAVVALGVLLPLFGLSLVAVLLLERFVLRQVPLARDWLGLV
jgi:hypothetical protein